MKQKHEGAHHADTPWIDPSQPGAFRVQSSIPFESDVITAHIGLIQSDTNADGFSNAMQTIHVQAYRVEQGDIDAHLSCIAPSCSDIEHGTPGESLTEAASSQDTFKPKPMKDSDDREIRESDSTDSTQASSSYQSQESPKNQAVHNVRSQLFIGLVAFLAIVTVIVVSVPLSLLRTRVPDNRYTRIQAIVQTISTYKDLNNSTSPQARALKWLAYNDALNVSESDPQWIRQRYIMAVFYYSTGGDSSWTYSFDFLQPTHECLWSNMTAGAGVGCDASNLMVERILIGGFAVFISIFSLFYINFSILDCCRL